MDGKHLDHDLGEASRPFADGRHFSASERINDRKHQPVAGHLDHSPMGGISQRQSESMTGSVDLLSASRPLTGERHFTALAGGSISVWLAVRACFFFCFFFFFCFCFCFVFVVVLGCVLVMQSVCEKA